MKNLFIAVFISLHIGALMGCWFAGLAYKPLIRSQGNELKAITNAKHRLEGRITYVMVETEAHVQDMNHFKKTSVLYDVLERLGIPKQLKM